jgi:hypothetical protein
MTRDAEFTDKTGLRGRRFKRPNLGAGVDAAPEAEPEVALAASAEDREAPEPNDDVMLDDEPDEADISDLLGHREADPKER